MRRHREPVHLHAAPGYQSAPADSLPFKATDVTRHPAPRRPGSSGDGSMAQAAVASPANSRISGNATALGGYSSIGETSRDLQEIARRPAQRRQWPLGERSRSRSVKRALDIVVSLTGLIALAPLMLLLALLVKLESRGPALFVQERVSQGGQTFNLLKFRTMRVNAEACSGPVFARPNDPRCTRTGRFMRRHSLDELPQLINVLRGEMSLVGPRPERPFFVTQFSQSLPRYHERHREKAGITGWAQVHGLRGNTSIEERIKHDLYYVEHWSVGLDLTIMAWTVVEMLRGRNAC